MCCQYRSELKYELNLADYYELRSRLSAVFKRDVHTSANGDYRIRSLYFDTPYDKALNDKLSGVSERSKFRIRCYNGDFSFIALEKKLKKGGLGQKLTSELTKAETESIIKGDIDFLKASPDDDIRKELYAHMRGDLLTPRVIVDYLREPFIYAPGNVRLTLDSQIRCGKDPAKFFSGSTTLPASDVMLLEVKYDAFLPDIVRDAIQLGSRYIGSFSKYAACRFVE